MLNIFKKYKTGLAKFLQSQNNMDSDMTVLTDEEVLAVVGQCNERLKELTARWRHDVVAPRKTAEKLQPDISAEMAALGVVAVVHADGCVRLQYKKEVQAALTPDLLLQVLNGVTEDVFREQMLKIDDERNARLRIWQAKHKPKPKPKSKTKRLKRDETVPEPSEAAEVVVLPEESLDDVYTRSVRKVGKYLARPLPPMARPLSRQEALTAVLYGLVEDAHRVTVPVIKRTINVGQTPRAQVMNAEHAPETLRVKTASFCSLMAQSTAAKTSIKAERPRYKTKMDACEPRVRAYIRSVAPDTRMLKRVLPTADGDRTITLIDKGDDSEESAEADSESESEAEAEAEAETEADKEVADLGGRFAIHPVPKFNLYTASLIIDDAVALACANDSFIRHGEESLFSYDDIPALASRRVLEAVQDKVRNAIQISTDGSASASARESASGSVVSRRSSKSGRSSITIRRTRLRTCAIERDTDADDVDDEDVVSDVT